MTHRAPLVSTQWLADHLGGDLVTLDASVVPYTRPDGRGGFVTGHERYLVDGHIPGAVFADLIDELSDPEGTYPFTRPDAARFEAAVTALGIGADTDVVVYDSAVGQWAARVWWLFRAFGREVRILDGGLRRWRDEGRALETGHVEPTPLAPDAAPLVAVERPELWIDKVGVEAIVRGDADATLVCATPPSDFSGETSPRPRAGRIPGSVSVPAGRVVDRERGTVISEGDLRSAFGGAVPAKPSGERFVTYCGGGIAAASAALALTLLGETDVAVYDGSLNEWAADPAAPLETGLIATA